MAQSTAARQKAADAAAKLADAKTPQTIDPPDPRSFPHGAAAKLAYIQANIGNVPKTGKTPQTGGGPKFDYFQEHGILSLFRPFQRQLAVTLVVDFPGGIEHDGNLTTLNARVRFTDTEAPLFIEVNGTMVPNPDRTDEAWYPIQATDNQGWGAAKAQTYGKKYAMQKYLAIPAEELLEAEDDAPPSSAAGNAPRKAPASEVAKVRKALQDAVAGMDPDGVAAFQQRVKGQLFTLNAQTVDDLKTDQLPGFQAWVLEQTARV